MALQGTQLHQLQQALLHAFPTHAVLAQMVRFGLDENLDAIAGTGKLTDVVYNLITWADAQGRIQNLVATARQMNGGNSELRAVATVLASPVPPALTSHGPLAMAPPAISAAVRVALPAEIDAIGENKEGLRRLLEQCHSRSGLVPFVGAGLSVPFSMPGWTAFLLSQARRIGQKAQIQAYVKAGRYEEAAEELEQRLTAFGLHAAIEENYGDHKLSGQLLGGAISPLPHLAKGPVLTTNFDRALERVFEQARQPFEHVVYGAKPDMVGRAMRQGRRYLLKLHGDWDERTDRILTKGEYELHYGSSVASDIDFTLPLPRSLQSILTGSSLLFVGCSLNADRTVATLAEVARKSPEIVHFAILEQPTTVPNRRAKWRTLATHNILPVWYPTGRHDLIEPLLAYLARHVNPR